VFIYFHTIDNQHVANETRDERGREKVGGKKLCKNTYVLIFFPVYLNHQIYYLIVYKSGSSVKNLIEVSMVSKSII
jgi:hypothetical protein